MKQQKWAAVLLSAAMLFGAVPVLHASAETAAEYTASAALRPSSGYNANVMRDNNDSAAAGFLFAPFHNCALCLLVKSLERLIHKQHVILTQKRP